MFSVARSCLLFTKLQRSLLRRFQDSWLHLVQLQVALKQVHCVCVRERFGKDTKVAHFIGAVKPWHLSYNRATKSVETAEGDQPDVVDFVHVWWKVFMEDVHYRLIADLASDYWLLVRRTALNLSCFLPRTGSELWGCKNRPAPFPGRMSYKATKPGLVCVLYLSMF